MRENSDTLLTALREHALLTVISVAVATAIALPLALIAHRVKWLSGGILAISGLLYTIPSLALFAFLAPFTGLSELTVIVGLVLYAILILVRNTVTGLMQVPTEVRDAAQGMGYGRLRQLFGIELPLALPSMITGLRIATVSTVALVTVGVVVGHGGLGELIIGGFQNNFYRAQITTAALLCVVLALVLDLVLAGVGRLATPWSRR